MTRDLALGVIGLALSGAYYLVATSIPESQLADAVGPQGLPRAYAVLLAALSLVLIGRELRTRHLSPQRAVSAQEPTESRRSVGRVAGMLAIGALYIAIVPWAGYVLSLAGLIAGTSYYQGGVMHRRVLLVGIAGALALWLLFVFVLGIPQPAGIWPSVV